MSTNAQIKANQQNAQKSTGPKTEAGKQRSSLNSTGHGFTGQQIILSPEENAAYDAHCIAYLDQYRPQTHEETDLILQYADQQWTLHQISVQQMTVLSIMNLATSQLLLDGAELIFVNTITAPYYKQLSTLGTYEQRRRRAAVATLAAFKALEARREAEMAVAAKTCTTLKAQGKPFNPQEFGFVHSAEEIDLYISRLNRFAGVEKSAAA
jgi:hypothetical protein